MDEFHYTQSIIYRIITQLSKKIDELIQVIEEKGRRNLLLSFHGEVGSNRWIFRRQMHKR